MDFNFDDDIFTYGSSDDENGIKEDVVEVITISSGEELIVVSSSNDELN